MKDPMLFDIARWFPDTHYYREHALRFAYSFSHLPRLSPGFRCLCIGSWGAEAPFLRELMGAGEVVAIRAPANGVPECEERDIKAPFGTKAHPVTLYTLDVEN